MSLQELYDVIEFSGVRSGAASREKSGSADGGSREELNVQLRRARRAVDTDPTEGQQEAGNYSKGHLVLHGLPISIENPKGSTRSGTDADGKRWSVRMSLADYGYIKRTEGKDGDHVDVFLGNRPEAEIVFVVNQGKVGNWDALDEHKCILGAVTEADAREIYLANYEKGWKGLKSIYPLTIPQFKWWLEYGDTTKEVKDGMFAANKKKTTARTKGAECRLTVDGGPGTSLTPPIVSSSVLKEGCHGQSEARDGLAEQPAPAGRGQGQYPAGQRTATKTGSAGASPARLGSAVAVLSGPEIQSLRDCGVYLAPKVASDDDFWNSPPNKAGRRCPGCGQLFKECEPLAGVDMCEVCERYGPPKKAADLPKMPAPIPPPAPLPAPVPPPASVPQPVTQYPAVPSFKTWDGSIYSPVTRAMFKTRRQDMGELNRSLHSFGKNTGVRPDMIRSVAEQATKPSQYRSDVGEKMLQRRYAPPARVQDVNSAGFADSMPAAVRGSQYAYVPPSLETVRFMPPEIKKLMTGVGHAAIANHEMSHAYKQPRNPKARGEGVDDVLINHALGETAPVIGDVLFRGEQFRQEEGKPLQHEVNLSGDKSHDINWMIDQAKKHGYFRGRSLQQLIFETPEGQQWYRQLLDQQDREKGAADVESPRPVLLAVDLDGTLAEEYEKFDPKAIGKPRPGVRKWMQEFRDAGAKLIIHTVRGDDKVTKAWADENDIPYDFINKNPWQPPNASDKLFADIYIDNRGVRATGPWSKIGPQVLRLMKSASGLQGLRDYLESHITGNVNLAKLADTPYWQRGLAAQLQQPTINPQQGLAANLLTNVQQAHQRGKDQIKDREEAMDTQTALQPGFALERFQRYIHGGDFVKNPTDRMLFRNFGNS